MTKEQRQQSLTAARRACKWLSTYYFNVGHIEEVAALLAEFKRLDEIEQKQIRAGKRYGKLGAQYGSKAPAPGKKRGRPRKETK